MTELFFVISLGMVLVALCFIVINQMLLVSAINKRIIYLAEDAISSMGNPISFNDIDPVEKEEDSSAFDPHDIEV